MNVRSQADAEYHARAHRDADTLVVSESGDVHVNCDVDQVCAQLKREKKKYFVLKGSETDKKSKK